MAHHLEAGDQLVVAFRMRGRHTGPLATPLGTVAPTGQVVTIRVTDVLTVVDGRVHDVWMIADDLALLRQLDAVTLTERAGEPRGDHGLCRSDPR